MNTSATRRVSPMWLALVAGLAFVQAGPTQATEPTLQPGTWRAWLDSPGGELPFDLELTRKADAWHASINSGKYKIDLVDVDFRHGELYILIAHYDATLIGTVSKKGTRIDGRWRKHGRGDTWSKLPFHATLGQRSRFKGSASDSSNIAPSTLSGRWTVKFSESDERSVAVFQCADDGVVTGTFLTPTGDYGHLEGVFDGRRLRLSTFDGAHAFLFDALIQDDGTLKGDFWSRDAWHETWTARRDTGAELPDPFKQTAYAKKLNLNQFIFKDLNGRARSLGDEEFAGRARIIEIFGSWCPNCHDASAYLADLDRRYRARGLSIVGLAFELTGDDFRDALMVRRFAKRHKATYPMLLAGTSDKDTAAKALPFLDKLRSYPTTIFLHADGRVRAVYTGFSGPATGQAFEKLKASYESIIEELLADDGP